MKSVRYVVIVIPINTQYGRSMLEGVASLRCANFSIRMNANSETIQGAKWETIRKYRVTGKGRKGPIGRVYTYRTIPSSQAKTLQSTKDIRRKIALSPKFQVLLFKEILLSYPRSLISEPTHSSSASVGRETYFGVCHPNVHWQKRPGRAPFHLPRYLLQLLRRGDSRLLVHLCH